MRGRMVSVLALLSQPHLLIPSIPPPHTHSPPQIDSSKPLPRQAAIRGPYTNTGSRDVGLDPNPKLSPPKL